MMGNDYFSPLPIGNKAFLLERMGDLFWRYRLDPALWAQVEAKREELRQQGRFGEVAQ